MTHIVVLDGYTVNPGDLSWAPLEALGSCRIHDRTPPGDVVSRSLGAQILLTNKAVLDASAIQQLPDLRYIGVLATGYNVVDLGGARERGISVTNVPAYSTASVVQLTFALLLELTHHVGQHAQGVRQGRWVRSPDFCYWEVPLQELAGQCFGIVGFGHVGRRVAQVAEAFGCRVLVHTRTPPTSRAGNVEFVDLATLLRTSDVVSLHCPLTEATRHLINRESLGWMKPTAILLNTGRGPLVDEAALAEALNRSTLTGAGLDVLAAEPPPADNPLLNARNCLITPHLGWATRAARERLLARAADNVKAFLAGRPENVVN